MDVVTMHQAKSNLSKLVKKAASGEEIYIGAYGKAQAKIVAADAVLTPRKTIGMLKGILNIPEDFDEPLPDEIVSEFEGK